MTAKNFFLFQTLLNLGFGIGLLFFPQALTDSYGTPHTDTTGTVDTLSRAYGAALTGFGVCAYIMRNANPSLGRYAFIIGCLIADVLVTIVHVRAITLGFENYTGWVTVLLLTIGIVWGGMLLSKEKRNALA